MSSADTARPLFLELRALGLKVQTEDDPDGDFLDYRIAIEGLNCLSDTHADRVMRLVRHNEEGLVQLLLDRRDPDLDAIRREGYCR